MFLCCLKSSNEAASVFEASSARFNSKKSGAFYVVYRTTVDGARKQVSHHLYERDRNTGYGSESVRAV